VAIEQPIEQQPKLDILDGVQLRLGQHGQEASKVWTIPIVALARPSYQLSASEADD